MSGVIELASGRDPAVLARTGLTARQTAASAWVIDAAGRRFAGAAAINRALPQLGGLWPALAGLYEIPPIRVLEESGYHWFARNRSRLAPLYRRIQAMRGKPKRS